MARSFRPRARGIFFTHTGRQAQVVERGQVREQVEALEHHADLGAHLVDLPQVLGQLDALDDDAAFLVDLQAIDAADQGRFARS